MEKLDLEEKISLGCAGFLIGCVILFVAFGCWLLYKIATGTFHLIDKAIQ